jgi:acyl-coenzyme A synthetase/AMP-(fatty) acid ligase
MKTGASLCIALDGQLLFPGKLLEWMEKRKVTLWKGVSSLLVYLAKTGVLRKERIPSLRTIMFAGEVMPTKYLIQWMETYPEKKFYNVYGPTEATGISLYYPVERIPGDVSERIPIGKPCSNTEVFLLKEDQIVALPGEVGELCIRGSGLSVGYWNDKSKTERAYFYNPNINFINDRIYRTGDIAKLRADGNYEFVGRMDFQVKYMGYRIELYEIENALLSFPAVNGAAVMLCESVLSELQELVAFVEVENGCSVNELSAHIGKLLPHYMIPKRIIKIDSIPLTSRGKTDREVIRKMYYSHVV